MSLFMLKLLEQIQSIKILTVNIGNIFPVTFASCHNSHEK